MKGIGRFLEGLFDDSIFYKNLYKIAFPIVIQNFIGAFLNMVDTVMIGRVGETEIAAVGIANQYFFFYSLIVISIYSGCGVFISQFWGKKDRANIRKVLGLGLISGILCTLLFMIPALMVPEGIIAIFNEDPKVVELGAKYLRIVTYSYIFITVTFSYSFASRSVGKTILPMVISAVALFCNTVLNYILIFGRFGAPEMGVEGAAIATLTARIIEAAVLVVCIYSKGGVLAASFREMTDLSSEFIVHAFRTIIPVMLNDACWGLGSVVYSVAYGRMGTQAVASIQICNTIMNLFMVLVFGMSDAAAVMVGNKIGAGEENEGRDYARRFSLLGVLAGIILGSFLAVSAPYMLNFFNVSYRVRYDSLLILYIFSITFIVKVYGCILIVGVFRGGGDARYAFLAEAFTMWCLGVPLVFLGALYFKLPVYQVVALLAVEEIAKFLLCAARLKSGKWVNNVVHNMG